MQINYMYTNINSNSNTSKQNDSMMAQSIDVRLEIEVPKNLTGISTYCLLIHDRVAEYIPLTREVKTVELSF